MIYIAVDTGEKSVVRGVFELPFGMNFEAAEKIILAAFEEAGESIDNRCADEIIEAGDSGIKPVSWLTVDVG